MPAEYSKKIKIKDFKINLFWGINENDFKSIQSVQMKIDLKFDRVLLSERNAQFKCVPENDCQYSTDIEETGNYGGHSYKYKDATTFLDFNRLFRGEVTNKDQMMNLKNFEIEMVQDKSLSGILFLSCVT